MDTAIHWGPAGTGVDWRYMHHPTLEGTISLQLAVVMQEARGGGQCFWIFLLFKRGQKLGLCEIS